MVAAALLLAACAVGTTSTTGDEAALDGGLTGDGSIVPGNSSDVEEPDPIYPDPVDGSSDASQQDSSKPPVTCKAGVVINEVQAESNSDKSYEFVELYNCGTQSVSLSGWKVEYQSGSGGTGMSYPIEGNQTIAAGAYKLFATSKVAGAKDGTFTGGFASDKGQIGLLDKSGKTVDGVAWGTVTGGKYKERNTAPTPGTGSIGRRPDGKDTDDNQSDFEKFPTPSPGKSN